MENGECSVDTSHTPHIIMIIGHSVLFISFMGTRSAGIPSSTFNDSGLRSTAMRRAPVPSQSAKTTLHNGSKKFLKYLQLVYSSNFPPSLQQAST